MDDRVTSTEGAERAEIAEVSLSIEILRESLD
jgi:hypothetical protein